MVASLATGIAIVVSLTMTLYLFDVLGLWVLPLSIVIGVAFGIGGTLIDMRLRRR